MSSENTGQANFDVIAPVYDLLGRLTFWGNIKKSQQYFLSLIPESSRILIIGGGSGWILTDILSLNKNIQHITYLEASSKMLAFTSERVTRFKTLRPNRLLPPVDLIQGTEADIPAEQQYDVIITYFILDLFNEEKLQQVMRFLFRAFRDNGIWLFADFNVSEKKPDRWWQLLWVQCMYWFFKITCQLSTVTLPDFTTTFQQFGLSPIHSKSFFRNMIVSKVYRKVDAH